MHEERMLCVLWWIGILSFIQLARCDARTRITLVDKDLRVYEKDDVSVTCTFIIDQMGIIPVFIWENPRFVSYIVPSRSDEIYLYTCQPCGISVTDSSSTLILNNVTLKDDGEIRCRITDYTYSSDTGRFHDNYTDTGTLTVLVPPKLVLQSPDVYIREYDDVTITCTAGKAKPAITKMWVSVGDAIEPVGFTTQQNGDIVTYAHSCALSFATTRAQNGKRVSCIVEWEGERVAESSKSLMNVVWPLESPENLVVNPGAESCVVEWKKDRNARSVAVCHTLVSSGQQCTEAEPGYVITGLRAGVSYTIWLQASNEIGSIESDSHNCTPMEATITSSEGRNVEGIVAYAFLMYMIIII